MAEDLERLAPGLGRARFPQVDQLFVVQVSPDKRSQDVECLGCGQKRKNTKFNRMINHATKCMESDRDIVQQLVANVERWRKEKVDQSKRDSGKANHANLQARCDDLLVKFIASSNLPVSVVQSRGLKQLLMAFNSDYILPNRKKVTYKLLPDIAKSCFEQSMATIKGAEDYSLTVEIDGWTSYSGSAILAVVLTTQSGLSMLLDLLDITHAHHSGDMLADLTLTAMKNSGISKEKFNAILSDEASNCKVARKLIVRRFPEDHLIQYRCMAHIFNLIGALISKCGPIKRHLEKLMSLITVIGRSKILSARLKEAGAKKLINTVPTRWYSISSAINSVLMARDQLEAIPKTTAFHYPRWGPIIEDDSFWSALKDCKIYFDRLAAMIGRAEAKDSLLCDSFHDLLEYLKFVLKDPSAEIYREVAVRAVIYHFGKLDKGLMLATYIVNPNYGFDYLTSDAIELAKQHLVKTLFDVSRDETAADAMMSEFIKYQGIVEMLRDEVRDPYTWWSKCRTPVLSSVARRLLALHGSSANTERIFSILTNIATPKRNLVSSSTMFDLVSINLFEKSMDPKPTRSNEQRSSASQPRSSQNPTSLSQDPASSSQVEDPAYEEEPGTYLFDPALLEEAGDPVLSCDFYSSPEYREFTSLIDFGITGRNSDGERNQSTQDQEDRRASDEMAKEFMSRCTRK